MRRLLLVVLALAAIAGAAWYLLRDDGLVEEVTEESIRSTLIEKRIPEPMADCMAPRLVDRLSLNQLRKLRRLSPEDGETSVPLSTGEALARLRRVDDRDAVETLVLVAGSCGFEMMLQGR